MDSPAVHRVGAEDVDDLVVGMSLLGSGGGGHTGLASLQVRRLLVDREIRVLSAEDLTENDVVVPVGIMGAIAVMSEKLQSGQEIADAVAGLRRWTGCMPTALIPIEVGGVNGLTAIIAAATLDLPLVDADLMGRAMPRLDQFTLVAAGRSITPCVVAEPGGQVFVLDGVGSQGVEDTLRSVVARTSGWGALAIDAVPGDLVAVVAVLGSLRRALSLGKALRALDPGSSGERIAAALGGRLLACGRVIDVRRQVTTGGFGRGSIVVRHEADGSVLRVEAENEYLAVQCDGAMVATCPDLIVLIDQRGLAVIQCDDVRPGRDVMLVTMPGPDWWRQDPSRLSRVGPRAFGIDHDPVLVDLP